MMTTLRGLHDRLLGLFELLRWVFPLLARFTIGVVFIESGWGKLHNIPDVIEFFTSLHIPAPACQAHFVACTEFLCGLGVALGALTRLASIPLIGTMVVAILTAKLEDIEGWSDILALSEYLYIVLLVGLIAYGPGPLSLDYVVSRRLGWRKPNS
jgi:putative oxidoreductase